MNPEHLRRAIALASEARTAGNPPFGSLLVGPDGSVLVEERNTTLTDGDITAHPELKVARWAARELDPQTAAMTTMYTSCEPCGMCAGALARSGIGHVVFALSGEQLDGLRTAGGFPPVPVDGPHLYEAAKAPVEGYYP
ncbi:tRNA(Arg) A34 adenosine deaminase TadA [Saccharothrix ecbatanensis]|uniref:tRNA(Arg) A34 adenosine deaminase TadA n=1 Tax=Saccharothrix ecbatanensis TaxID=1105145 RepID=A0A7W9M113_9PSEU|nr:nucleoside deaminase [Saccharothrix ecbatanensis]MBB5803352.1 tRNA(Arg) A34 adenosine deaminase TadA [Saccharothrix ecbatanensis]